MLGPLGADYARYHRLFSCIRLYLEHWRYSTLAESCRQYGMPTTPIRTHHPFATPPPCLTSPLYPSSFLLQSQTLSGPNLHRMIDDSRCWKIVLRTARVRQFPITISYSVSLHLPSTRVLKSLHPTHVREPKYTFPLPRYLPVTSFHYLKASLLRFSLRLLGRFLLFPRLSLLTGSQSPHISQ